MEEGEWRGRAGSPLPAAAPPTQNGAHGPSRHSQATAEVTRPTLSRALPLRLGVSVVMLLITLVLSASPGLHAATRSSANYSISAETTDGGGRATSSANYTAVASLEPGSISTSTSSNYQVQHGFIAVQVVAVAVLVEGRWVFYNHSAWDNNDASANASDDSAVATDKGALLPGGTATFANYSSYDKGINGIMVDIANLPGTPAAADFAFRTGNDNSPSGWAIASDPASITVRPGAGVGGSDRVTLIWNDNNLDGVVDANEAVAKAWLQVTVKATANTGLASDEVFYFGNAPAESGNSAANAQVDLLDEIGARNNPRSFLDPAPIGDVFDYTRDKKVDLLDEILARNNGTSFLDALGLITPTDSGSAVTKAVALQSNGIVKSANAVSSNLVVALPTLTLAYNEAGQSFVIPVSNSGSAVALNGVQLELIVGDGDVAVGGSGGAPAITGVSLLDSGLLFATNNTGDRGLGNFSSLRQVFERLTSTATDTVQVSNGTTPLAVVTFDTTGIAPGVYHWSAASSPNGSSFFTDTNASPQVTPVLVDGTLTIGTPLSIMSGGGGLRVTWPGSSSNQLQLESTSDLANGPWLPVKTAPAFDANTGLWSYQIQVSPDVTQEYFRLVPQPQL